MQLSVGMPSPMVMTARHLVKRAPRSLYSASLSPKPSRPWVNFSLGERGMLTVLLSTFMPGMTPWLSSTVGIGVPSEASWRRVSSKRITPERNSPMPSVVKSISLYCRRLSSEDSMPTASNLLPIVPKLSSAARMPFPGATSSLAVFCNSCTFTSRSFRSSTSKYESPEPQPGALVVIEFWASPLGPYQFAFLLGLHLLGLLRLLLAAPAFLFLPLPAGLLLHPVLSVGVAHGRCLLSRFPSRPILLPVSSPGKPLGHFLIGRTA